MCRLSLSLIKLLFSIKHSNRQPSVPSSTDKTAKEERKKLQMFDMPQLLKRAVIYTQSLHCSISASFFFFRSKNVFPYLSDSPYIKGHKYHHLGYCGFLKNMRLSAFLFLARTLAWSVWICVCEEQ